jgi:hypothetical protein
MLNASSADMNREVLRGGVSCEVPLRDPNEDVQTRVLRSQLMSLALDWELAALALDAQRYRAAGNEQRESLRDSAVTYRKCIAELSELLSGSALLACKRKSDSL